MPGKAPESRGLFRDFDHLTENDEEAPTVIGDLGYGSNPDDEDTRVSEAAELIALARRLRAARQAREGGDVTGGDSTLVLGDAEKRPAPAGVPAPHLPDPVREDPLPPPIQAPRPPPAIQVNKWLPWFFVGLIGGGSVLGALLLTLIAVLFAWSRT